jgi:hypothetical protein
MTNSAAAVWGAVLWFFVTRSVAGINQNEICVSESKTFTARVDLFAGELGYYVLEECGDVLNPTIAMEVGEVYTFIQKDRTNYLHRKSVCFELVELVVVFSRDSEWIESGCLLSFLLWFVLFFLSPVVVTAIGIAYSPYGDEDLKVEVQPGTSKGRQGCITNHTCPAPMYFLNDEYLGKYSNIEEIKPITTGEDDFGLNAYEPLFLRNPHEWSSFGTFSLKLRIDDDTISNDLFYFCHIHEFMGGRIKLTKSGKVINELDSPSLGYEYDVVSDFDKQCGTFGLEEL